MKRRIFIVTFLLICYLPYLSAQNKQVEKIAAAYNSGKYEDCIAKSEKYSEKDSKTPEPYYYNAAAKFQIYKATDYKVADTKLKTAIRATYKAITKDKDQIARPDFEPFLAEMKDSMLSRGAFYFANLEEKIPLDYKIEAKFYYEFIEKIYKDTTQEYKDLFLPKPIKQELAFTSYSGPVNQTDMSGIKQGLWVEYYKDSPVVKSEINFVNGKPVGTFRKYYENGKLKANLVFDTDSRKVSAILYDDKGNRVSMGYYYDQKKDSTWQYFISDSILFLSEKYNEGTLNGAVRIYYWNGNILEEKNYKDGVLDGVWRRYYYSGQEMFHSIYVNGKLSGPYNKFYENGVLNISGKYEEGQREGKWYFCDDENGRKMNIEYTGGVPNNQDELELEDNKEFKEMEKNKDMFTEPQFIKDMDGWND